jgi:hypothetical protein
MTSNLGGNVKMYLGKPLLANICIQNNSGASISTFSPDRYNITVTWRKKIGGTAVCTRCLFPPALGIPDDLIDIDNGEEVCVTVDISETVAPGLLEIEELYLIDLYYSNWTVDWEYDFANSICTVAPDPCYPNIWVGWTNTDLASPTVVLVKESGGGPTVGGEWTPTYTIKDLSPYILALFIILIIAFAVVLKRRKKGSGV